MEAGRPRQRTLCVRCGVQLKDPRPNSTLCRDCKTADRPLDRHARAKLREEELRNPEGVAAFEASLYERRAS